MKKAIITLVTLTAFCGCAQPDNRGIETRYGDYVTKVIDSCEYLEYDFGIFDSRVYSLTHKGNCKYCKERSTK